MKIGDYFASLERGLPQNPLLGHLHIGPQDRLAPSDQPSLGQVLVEIAAWLEASSLR